MRWKARFSGQHILDQFGTNGKEVLFKNVLDRQDELENFELAENGKIYSVNLKTGMVTINGINIFPITEQELGMPLKDVHYRIIYYRRMKVETNLRKVGEPKLMCYLLGWQCLVNGKNFQRVLHIYENGNLFLQMNK